MQPRRPHRHPRPAVMHSSWQDSVVYDRKEAGAPEHPHAPKGFSGMLNDMCLITRWGFSRPSVSWDMQKAPAMI